MKIIITEMVKDIFTFLIIAKCLKIVLVFKFFTFCSSGVMKIDNIRMEVIVYLL